MFSHYLYIRIDCFNTGMCSTARKESIKKVGVVFFISPYWIPGDTYSLG